MSDATRPTHDEVHDLLALRATEGLDADDQQRYDRLVAADPALAQEAERYEQAAAAVDVALHERSIRPQSLTPELRRRLLADALQHTTTPGAPKLQLAGTPAAAPPADTRPLLLRPAAFGWYAAAAALVALAFVLAKPPNERVVERIVEVPVQPNEEATPPLAEQYAALDADAGTVRAAWGYNPDGGDPRFAEATGEVIFNPDQQAGYMKLTGLPANDPTQEQYQLWIVDATRGGQNTDRIDGGVFDVTEAGEVIIPIDAKLKAREPVVFAITVETPGGVVESKGPLHVVAAVSAG